MEWISEPATWIGLLTLVALEIVLGIDNIVFISILSGKLPAEQQERARRLGIGAAVVSRILLLFSIAWVVRLTTPIFTIFSQEISGRDLILIFGGLFLIAKATHEIHAKLEGEEEGGATRVASSFTSVIIQIMLLDIIFSLDSVITAVGMVEHIEIMVAAVLIAAVVMVAAAGTISSYVNQHPTLKILALSFLLLIGTTLIMEGLQRHIPKGYVYFAMGFSVFVEALNLRVRKHSDPVQIHQPVMPDQRDGADGRAPDTGRKAAASVD